MKDLDWPAIILVSILIVLFTPKLWASTGEGWHPTANYRDINVLMNWTFQDPVPCGKHKNAGACAFLPNEASIPKPGKVCIIIHPKLTQRPTTREFVELGNLLDGCIEAAGTRTMIIRFETDGEKRDVQATNRYFKALPCGISAAPKVGDKLDWNTARKWGHELAHCWRGSWHD